MNGERERLQVGAVVDKVVVQKNKTNLQKKFLRNVVFEMTACGPVDVDDDEISSRELVDSLYTSR